MDTTSQTSTATKIPQVTLVFWVMKIAATTLGETGGDLLAQTMKIGYAISTVILLGIMFATLAAQLRLRGFSPALYWTVIATTSMAGTTISDYIDRTLQWGYYKGSVVLVALLIAALVFWKVKFGSLSISRVNRFSLEVMFWTVVLIANTLGTALGDWMSDNTGLGFGRATVVITALLGVVALLHFRTSINKVVLFWVGFVLIQPFGATAGDFVTKKQAIGGMGFPTYYASAILTAILIVMILKTNARPTVAHGPSAPRRRSVAARSMASTAGAPDRLAPADPVTAPTFAAPEPARDGVDEVDDDLVRVLQLAAASATRIQTETDTMAERVRAEVAAFAEQQRALASRVLDTQRARQEAAASAEGARRMMESARRVRAEAVEEANRLRAEAEAEVAGIRQAAVTEASEFRARAERQAAEMVERATAQAAKRTKESERRLEELHRAEAAVLERLHQARTLFESVFHNTRPPEPVAALADGPADIDTLDIREPGAVDAAWGNGAH